MRWMRWIGALPRIFPATNDPLPAAPLTSPPMAFSTGTSSEHAVAQTPEKRSASKSRLSASMSTASCSSPNVLMHDVAEQDAVRTWGGGGEGDGGGIC